MMSAPTLYRGMWPRVVAKLGKYSVQFKDGAWRITVLYDVGDGLRYLAVAGTHERLVERVNLIKRALRDGSGGVFYINEYRHVIVPVSIPSSGEVQYYFADWLDEDLEFEFEGRRLTTQPLGVDGTPLRPGDPWVGPRPGIPYKLRAGGVDAAFESPALTDDSPPRVRPGVTRQVFLSRLLDGAAASRAAAPIRAVRGHQGGRFYVNEHQAIFTPVGAGDGNGLDYIYCGQLDMRAWFPEPSVELWEP